MKALFISADGAQQFRDVALPPHSQRVVFALFPPMLDRYTIGDPLPLGQDRVQTREYEYRGERVLVFHEVLR